MSGQWHGGKGSNMRKMDHQQFSDNWDKIFSKKKCLECGETNDHHTNQCSFEQTTGHYHALKKEL